MGLLNLFGARRPSSYRITLMGQPLAASQLSAVAIAISTSTVEWAVQDKVAHLYISAGKFDETKLNAALASHPAIDCIVQGEPVTPKKLLISDMDSTMIHQECIDELADFVGKKAEVAAITERAMNGELVFEAALKERVVLLKGLPVSILQECFETKIRPMEGAKELVSAFKKQGGKAVLVSGGFSFFTERVAKLLGFDEHYANTLETAGGKLTGTVALPILGKEAKLAELKRQCGLLGIKPQNVLAIGDGANDLPMLKAAGLGVAFRAKPMVQAQANAKLNHAPLDALIHLLG